jgi:hypothetical protein
MSFLQTVMERVNPPEKPKKDDSLVGFGSQQEMLLQGFDQIAKTIDQSDRATIMKDLREMSHEGAIPDKALTKLCQDATFNEVSVDAPKQRKNIIEALLKRIKYQDIRQALLYAMMRDGDLFLQLEYAKSQLADKVGYITKIMMMPPETMIRNTNQRDEFAAPNRAFAQVDSIQNALLANQPIWFPWPKIVHGRNDEHKGKFFRYGWSMWASGVKTFNMAMMQLEDSAIGRHLAAQRLRVHQVGKESQAGSDQSLIDQYKRNVKQQLTPSTTDLFIDGKTDIKELGGSKQSIGSVDDVMLALSILSIALEYPVDLLSGMISNSTGGEELFRKEIVLKRAIQALIKKENQQILRPIIDNELFINGKWGDYRINTFPSSFEDENKKSKRGLSEVAGGVKAPSRYHAENYIIRERSCCIPETCR